MGKVFKPYRAESKSNWGAHMDQGDNISSDKIQLGAILRIADSLERIEQPYLRLLAERERYERWYNEEKVKRRKLERQNAAYRGVINRMKKQKS
jgi:hypothetical protein